MTQPAPTPGDEPPYQRCRFTAPIPRDRRYTRDHLWLQEESPGLWRVGLTPWAVRMAGDFVEYHFDVAPGAPVKLHDPLGSLEAFKGLVEIRSVATGTLVQFNPILETNLDALSQDCYGIGWLYRIQGIPDPDLCDAAAYRLLLDQTIDTLRGSSPAEP
jgi:glycine cleavage system H protein